MKREKLIEMELDCTKNLCNYSPEDEEYAHQINNLEKVHRMEMDELAKANEKEIRLAEIDLERLKVEAQIESDTERYEMEERKSKRETGARIGIAIAGGLMSIGLIFADAVRPAISKAGKDVWNFFKI